MFLVSKEVHMIGLILVNAIWFYNLYITSSILHSKLIKVGRGFFNVALILIEKVRPHVNINVSIKKLLYKKINFLKLKVGRSLRPEISGEVGSNQEHKL